MATIFLLLGSNMGDCVQLLAEARKQLEFQVGKLLRSSALYQTAAWGNTEQSDFINQVIKMETRLDPQKLLGTILAIEKEMGRLREVKWGPRTIDIDILYYEQEVINLPELKIPHPNLHQRAFTLVPLCEMEPLWLHPVLHQTNHQLLMAIDDVLSVHKLQ
ncbi:MAG: 2-amino-4-hydroxy-6-hydroxymethyldihydropteridine diphosphokinase [Bacteroidota bacterium]|jgi:2-amino-4-hydroxy-6-hydroxymethyldihydropteridine diphosphokinase